MVGNAVGKGETACYDQFLFFPYCFQERLVTTPKNMGLFWKRLKHFHVSHIQYFSLMGLNIISDKENKLVTKFLLLSIKSVI